MTFHDWIYSNYPADAAIDGRYGALHIGVMIACVAMIILIAFLRRRDEKIKQGVLTALAVAIAVLEIARRVINLCRGLPTEWDSWAYLLIPRPWCAISCWLTMYTVLFGKKTWLYNFSAMNSLLCALVFFAYPSVGFNQRVILFENVYSIATHSLLLISAISMITLGFADFRLKASEIFSCAGLLAGVFLYATAEILLGIERDPLYFMPGNDVQAFLGVNYPAFLVIYVGFLAVYFSAFYLVRHLVTGRKKKASPVS